jgi:hypothetical protein
VLLQDPDLSIRRRALDLLFTMCDQGNAVTIVDELVKYLVVADFTMREELVLKIAILAEKYAPTVQVRQTQPKHLWNHPTSACCDPKGLGHLPGYVNMT